MERALSARALRPTDLTLRKSDGRALSRAPAITHRRVRAWRPVGGERDAQPFLKFSSAKSQFTRWFKNVSMNFGRAFR